MRKQWFGSFESEPEIPDGHTHPMDWRDHDNDIQQSTRTRLKDKDDQPEGRKPSAEDGVTLRQRIG